MPLTFARVRTLLLDVPRSAKLAYCLVRDDRVPAAPKAALLATMGVIVSPLDLPAWIPVIGELDVLALGVLAVKVFIEACPEELVQEHRTALRRGESLFDTDWQGLTGSLRGRARALLRRAFESRPERPQDHSQRALEDRTA